MDWIEFVEWITRGFCKLFGHGKDEVHLYETICSRCRLVIESRPRETYYADKSSSGRYKLTGRRS